MKIILSIDDTDQIDGPGTGQLAESLCQKIAEKGWGNCSAISRHQLFVHPDIPYTSHNSAMAFEAEVQSHVFDELVEFTANYLRNQSAPGSDPGLCVVMIDPGLNLDKLIAFGQKAKQVVLEKQEAYALAGQLNVKLSEHGGTGQGVIGALAGAGLRLSGNDGRFRGWYHLGQKDETMSVKQLKAYFFIDEVKTVSGQVLPEKTNVLFGGDKIKIVYKGFQQVLLVKPGQNGSQQPNWITLTKTEVKKF